MAYRSSYYPQKYGSSVGSSGGGGMSRNPSYSSLSSDGGGYSSSGAGGSYRYGYTPNKFTPSTASKPSVAYERPNSSYSRPGYASGSGYTSDYARGGYKANNGYTSDYGGGYASDYGRSGYVSGSGYTSDYGRTPYTGNSGYTSDYGRRRSSNYNTTPAYTSQAPYRSTTARTKESSPTRNYSSNRYGSYSRSSSKEEPTPHTNRLSYSRSVSREDGSSYSSRNTNSRSYVPTYTRSTSKEEPSKGQAKKTSTREPDRKTQSSFFSRSGMNQVEAPVVNGKEESRKPKENKAPADFTTDDSSSDEEDSPNEDVVCIYLISRATSPSQVRTNSEKIGTISSAIKRKVPQTKKSISKTCDVSQQTDPEEVPKWRISSSTSTSLPRPSFYNKYSRPSSCIYVPRSGDENKASQVKVTAKENSHLPVLVTNGTPVVNGSSSNKLSVSADDSEKKDFRKSVLNMNISAKEMDEYNRKQQEKREAEKRVKERASLLREPDKPRSREASPGIKRTYSRGKMDDDHRGGVVRNSSRSKLDVEDEQRGIRKTHSRTKMASRSSHDSDSTDESDDDKSPRRLRRPRRNRSREDLLDQDSPKHAGSHEGALDDRPPRPQRQGSKENLLDSSKQPKTEKASSLSSRSNSSDDKSNKLEPKVKNASKDTFVNNKPAPSSPVQIKITPTSTEKTAAVKDEKKAEEEEESEEESEEEESESEESEEEEEEQANAEKSPAEKSATSITISTKKNISENKTDGDSITKTGWRKGPSTANAISQSKSTNAVAPSSNTANQGWKKSPSATSIGKPQTTDALKGWRQNSNSSQDNTQNSGSSSKENSTQGWKSKLSPEKRIPGTPETKEPESKGWRKTPLSKTPSGLSTSSSKSAVPKWQKSGIGNSKSCGTINNAASVKLSTEAGKKDTSGTQRSSSTQNMNDKTTTKNVLHSKANKTNEHDDDSNKFIGKVKDIDSLLNDGDENAESFEEFEKKIDSAIENDKHKAKLQIETFIGKCRDIDDMLGLPSPVSPVAQMADSRKPFECARSSTVIMRSNTQGKMEMKKQDVPCSSEETESSSEEEDVPLKRNSGSGSFSEGTSSSALEEIDAKAVKVHDSKAIKPHVEAYTEEIDSSAVRIRENKAIAPTLETYTEEIDSSGVRIRLPKKMKGQLTKAPTKRLDDCTLQLHKHNNVNGDYGSYLDLESTIDEQAEEFEGFDANRKNSVLLRTQLSVRVHGIIEKLLNSDGRELRRALFSLKQIFQDDKDLVHEFVQNNGLACLIKVGSEADQNYQNYILRALGQVMLYVDGMNGVTDHPETVQWLYSLIASKFRLVVKTALKLLLVFVEYTETNCSLLINVINGYDTERGSKPWLNIMSLLSEKDASDMELLVYAMTLVNKTLNGIPDQDTYYDVVDSLEEQGMERIIQRYMTKAGSDLDLLQQFHIYEAVLKHEDGDDDGKPLLLDAQVRQIPRSRKSLSDENDRRKSRRHSVGTMGPSSKTPKSLLPTTPEEPQRKSWNSSRDTKQNDSFWGEPTSPHLNGANTAELNGMTPALRRRRDRDARQRSFIKEQEECAQERLDTAKTLQPPDEAQHKKLDWQRSRNDLRVEDENRKNREKSISALHDDLQKKNQEPHSPVALNRSVSKKDINEANQTNRQDNSVGPNKKSWMLSMMYSKSQDDDNKAAQDEPKPSFKDLQEKIRGSSQVLLSPTETSPPVGGLSGLVSKAKEGLSQQCNLNRNENNISKVLVTPSSPPVAIELRKENDLQWEQLMKTLRRPLLIDDMDFTDLDGEDDTNIFQSTFSGMANGIPPPPPPFSMGVPPPPGPPPPPGMMGPPPPPPLFGAPPPPPPCFKSLLPQSFTVAPPMLPNGPAAPSGLGSAAGVPKTMKKNKKTIKLFWKEVKHDPLVQTHIKRTIWDDMKPTSVDCQKLEHLFESRAKDLINKERQQDVNKSKEIIVLDPKRSNAINIGMTKLPPPRTIKTAILKMDSTIMNREGIEKILITMMPTEEEKAKITEAQMSNPDVPLGSAEQFLMTLASISELPARLKLWAFKLDYDIMEKEVAEPLMDLKQSISELQLNKTFKSILATLLSIGNFLNGLEIKGFQIEYLAKVPEVKDTVHKHSLLHHLCHMVMERHPDSSDLYSEIGSATRASKVDFDELAANLQKMEVECKASWDRLKMIAKHDGSSSAKVVRMTEFLADCAERIIVLGVIHRRVINRFRRLLCFLGIPSHIAKETKVNQFLKIISEFALEYRTTRERVLQQFEKKANHRERNKTRGKMITDVGKFKSHEMQADEELRQLLGSGMSDTEDYKWGRGTIPGVRGRARSGSKTGSLGRNIKGDESLTDGMTDGDDEILESLVKTATAPSTRATPKERKRARQADRKSSLY